MDDAGGVRDKGPVCGRKPTYRDNGEGGDVCNQQTAPPVKARGRHKGQGQSADMDNDAGRVGYRGQAAAREG